MNRYSSCFWRVNIKPLLNTPKYFKKYTYCSILRGFFSDKLCEVTKIAYFYTFPNNSSLMLFKKKSDLTVFINFVFTD